MICDFHGLKSGMLQPSGISMTGVSCLSRVGVTFILTAWETFPVVTYHEQDPSLVVTDWVQRLYMSPPDFLQRTFHLPIPHDPQRHQLYGATRPSSQKSCFDNFSLKAVLTHMPPRESHPFAYFSLGHYTATVVRIPCCAIAHTTAPRARRPCLTSISTASLRICSDVTKKNKHEEVKKPDHTIKEERVREKIVVFSQNKKLNFEVRSIQDSFGNISTPQPSQVQRAGPHRFSPDKKEGTRCLYHTVHT